MALSGVGSVFRIADALTDRRVLAPALLGLGAGLLTFVPNRPVRTVGLLGLLGGLGFAAWRFYTLATEARAAGPAEASAERAAQQAVLSVTEKANIVAEGFTELVKGEREAIRVTRGETTALVTPSSDPVERALDVLTAKLEAGTAPTDRERGLPTQIIRADNAAVKAAALLEREGIPITSDVGRLPPLLVARARGLELWIAALNNGVTPSDGVVRLATTGTSGVRAPTP